MCKINDSETNIQEVIQSEEDLTKTYATIFIMIYHVFGLSLLFFIYFLETPKNQNLLKEKLIARRLITSKRYVVKINHLVRQLTSYCTLSKLLIFLYFIHFI